MAGKGKKATKKSASDVNVRNSLPDGIDPSKYMRLSDRFAAINKLITRDLNGRYTTPSFALHTKDEITTYLKNPYNYETQIRESVIYIYGASSYFRRIIQYFTGLSDYAYVLSPHKIDPAKVNIKTFKNNYRKALAAMSSMMVKTQFPKIVTTCLREDTFFGTMRPEGDSIIIQQLPFERCKVSSIEDNVLNVTFDFSYFDSNSQYLEFYPIEFQTKYNLYLKDRVGLKWQELDSPNSFAVKANNDILEYSLPPFVGVLREIYDLEDYKQLKLTKTELENYAILVMSLGMDKDGNYLIDYNKAVDFWRNLDGVLPEEVGSVLSPMPISKISFDKSNTGDSNTIADAEQNLFTAAGVSSLLFNNERASANALTLSIKADQAITYGIIKSLEDVVNRYLHRQSFGKTFKVSFLDCSPFNRKELGDAYLKACQYGVPMIAHYCASQGLNQEDMEGMNFLENDILQLPFKFVPLQSSSTRSASIETNGATDEGGAPPKEIDELSDKGEETRESE